MSTEPNKKTRVTTTVEAPSTSGPEIVDKSISIEPVKAWKRRGNSEDEDDDEDEKKVDSRSD